MRRIFFSCFLLALLHSNLSTGDQKGYLGPLWGVSFPNLSSNVFTWGFQGAYKTSPIIGVGPFIMKYGLGLETSTEAGTAKATSSSFYYGGILHVFLQGNLKGFDTGCKVGIAHITNEITAANSSSSIQISNTLNKLFLAPRVAYEYPIGRFAAGAEITYFLGFGDDAPRVFSFLLLPRFRF